MKSLVKEAKKWYGAKRIAGAIGTGVIGTTSVIPYIPAVYAQESAEKIIETITQYKNERGWNILRHEFKDKGNLVKTLEEVDKNNDGKLDFTTQTFFDKKKNIVRTVIKGFGPFASTWTTDYIRDSKGNFTQSRVLIDKGNDGIPDGIKIDNFAEGGYVEKTLDGSSLSQKGIILLGSIDSFNKEGKIIHTDFIKNGKLTNPNSTYNDPKAIYDINAMKR